MSYVMNATAALPATDAAAVSGPSLRQRFYNALIESRRRSASRELRQRSYLINEAEIVLGGFPQTALSSDSALPFNR